MRANPKSPHRMSVLFLVVTAVCSTLAPAGAPPPERVNYQGVLRDSGGVPLSGTYDMWFRFFDDAVAGDEILVDQHAAATANAITVSGGLLDVALGTGTVSDGGGPGTYTLLSEVFRDYTDVWLEIQVDAETLSPRVQIQSVPYALNASALGGLSPSDFIDTSAATQVKSGRLFVGVPGVRSADLSTSNVLYAATFYNTEPGSAGIGAQGEKYGALFNAGSDPSGIGLVATSGNLGAQTAGWFHTYGPQATEVTLATSNTAVSATDGDYAGYFSTDWTNSTGVYGSGTQGGRFSNLSGSVAVDLATATRGVSVVGGDHAGHFETSKAGSTGLWASGTSMGGHFESSGGVTADVATSGLGISAHGPTGGRFSNAASSVTTDIATSTYGVDVSGGGTAGRFQTTDPGSTGVWASGADLGGSFNNSTTGGTAWLAYNGYGIQATGSSSGGYFTNTSPYFSFAYLPITDRGIYAHGSAAGGAFDNSTTGSWGLVGYSSYKILGSGAVSFTQNHPEDPSRVIVYAAPEGDEVAVYTRGSGRLVDGEARVKLGDTFRWVTNPDIGLTAHLTPVGEWADLYVASRSTDELVVRSRDPRASDVAFDYMVWGLRVGFEEQSIVQPKRDEAKIPSMHLHAKFFEDDPSLRGHTALARFERMEEAVHGRKRLDFSRADSLRDAIGVNPPGQPGPMTAGYGGGVGPHGGWFGPAARGARGAGELAGSPEDRGGPGDVVGDSAVADLAARGANAAMSSLDLFFAQGALEVGDVVSLAVDSPGDVVRSAAPADALVIGCVQVTEESSDRVAVATSRIAVCRVSAAYGSIEVGDRLSPSPIAGTAMKADGGPAGTVVMGRAIEPLESGTGLVRVLLGVK